MTGGYRLDDRKWKRKLHIDLNMAIQVSNPDFCSLVNLVGNYGRHSLPVLSFPPHVDVGTLMVFIMSPPDISLIPVPFGAYSNLPADIIGPLDDLCVFAGFTPGSVDEVLVGHDGF